jgi:hypothetical protein
MKMMMMIDIYEEGFGIIHRLIIIRRRDHCREKAAGGQAVHFVKSQAMAEGFRGNSQSQNLNRPDQPILALR